MGPGLCDTSCTIARDLSVVLNLKPRVSNTICQRLGMFPSPELVGLERGKGVQVSPSKFPCASTLILFRIFAYLCLLPPWLHMDPCYLCVCLQQLGLHPHQKATNQQTKPTEKPNQPKPEETTTKEHNPQTNKQTNQTPQTAPLSVAGAQGKRSPFGGGGEAASLQWL